jgi:subtilase family serine protease
VKKTFAPLAAFAGLFVSGLLLSGAGPTQAAPQSPALSAALVRLPGHLMPGVLRNAALLGRKAGGESVPLALTLPIRDPTGLDNLLYHLYTPGDPLFHHFLTPAEFTNRFCPTQQAYAAVAAFAQASGLSVTGTHANRLLLEVSGPSSAVEAAFHVQLQNYEAADGRVFHAPDAEPAVPASLAGKLSCVIGLQNSSVWRPHLQRQAYSFQPAVIGSGPQGGLTPSDVKAAYSLDQTTLTGVGRTLGLLELDGFTPSDITTYENAYHLPQVPVQTILTDNFSGVPGNPLYDDGPSEVTLDIELMAALAPGASAIRVYEAPGTDAGVLAAFARIADDNIAKEVSTSWGQPENDAAPATRNTESSLFQQMATQGQSLYAASADQGAYDNTQTLSVDDPSSQPFVTGVGGTTLNIASPGGPYEAESAWGDPTTASFLKPKGSGGGGGISSVWPIPSYQMNVAGLASTTQRNVPDVSLDSNPNTGYSVFYNGSWDVYGGTSCAAPLWAAFTALVNQQRQARKQADLGFPNTAIYQIATGTHYSAGFHDIADGSTNLYYPATRGYDNATGWGSFNGANLLALLAPAVVLNANPVSSLTLTPPSVVGGLDATGTVTLTNPAPTAGAVVTLTVTGSAPVSVPTSVTIAAGASSTDFAISTMAVTAPVTASITAAYSGGTQPATLTVNPAPVIITPASLSVSPASVGGGASSVGTVTLSGPAPDAGLTVSLASSDPSAAVPASVAVPAGAVSATFPVTTVPVVSQATATLSATLNSVTQTTTLTVLAPALEPIALAPDTVTGGTSAVATLTLTFPAPTGGVAIALTSSAASAVVPASVTIPAGQTSVPVTITTTAVPITAAVTLTATYAGITKKTTLTVKAALLAGLSLAPPSVIGGAATVGTLSLGSAAPAAGFTATLASSDPAALLPATLTIPPGAVSVSFPIPTAAVSAAVTATLTATLNGIAQSATLTIQPVQLTALTLTPASVVTGSPVTGSLTLNAPAPAGGLVVALSSSSASATVPGSLLIPAGAETATFAVATPHSGSAVISVLLSGTPQTATLTVRGAPGTTYPAGLNLISAPYDYTGVPLDSLFGYSGVLLAAWQPVTAAYALTPNAPADAMHLGQGYWVNLPTAVTLSSAGTPADTTHDFSIALQPGWNQIGDPFITPVTLGNVTVTAGSAAVPFSQATTATPLLLSSLVYRYAPKSGTAAGSYVWVRSTESLQPGLGYWVYAYQAVTLTVPHP